MPPSPHLSHPQPHPSRNVPVRVHRVAGGCDLGVSLLRCAPSGVGGSLVHGRARVVTLLRLTAALVVAGAVVAGLLFPWLGGPTWVASQGTGLLGATPSELTDEPPAGNSVVLAANGEPITWFYDENRSPV